MTLYNPEHLYVRSPMGAYIKVEWVVTGRLGFSINAADKANEFMKHNPQFGVIEVLRNDNDRRGMTDLVLLADVKDIGRKM